MPWTDERIMRDVRWSMRDPQEAVSRNVGLLMQMRDEYESRIAELETQLASYRISENQRLDAAEAGQLSSEGCHQ